MPNRVKGLGDYDAQKNATIDCFLNAYVYTGMSNHAANTNG